MNPERGRKSRVTAIAALLLTVGACAPHTRPIAVAPLLPPPEANLRPVGPPKLEHAHSSNTGDVGDYTPLISNILAVELAPIFGLPEGAENLVHETRSRHLAPVLDAVTAEIIIPMLFEALDQREQAQLVDVSPRISLGDRERLYRLIINVAMARVWQTASGDAAGKAAYLTHLATRSTGRGDDAFLAWRGIDDAVWRQRIREHLQPADRPFVVLGLLTSHYLHTHVFSITGYLVARHFAEALIDQGVRSAKVARGSGADIDALAAELMDWAKLPLLGIDSLLTIAANWAEQTEPPMLPGSVQPVFAVSEAAMSSPCRSWRFFRAADLHLIGERTDDEHHSDQAYAERIEASLRDQEHAVARHLSAVLPGRIGSPIRFAGFDAAAWKALVQDPTGCARPLDVSNAADIVPRRKTAATKPGNQACEIILRAADVVADDRLHAPFCAQIERMFRKDARDLFLANLAKGRLSAAERSVLTVGLALVAGPTS